MGGMSGNTADLWTSRVGTRQVHFSMDFFCTKYVWQYYTIGRGLPPRPGAADMEGWLSSFAQVLHCMEAGHPLPLHWSRVAWEAPPQRTVGQLGGPCIPEWLCEAEPPGMLLVDCYRNGNWTSFFKSWDLCVPVLGAKPHPNWDRHKGHAGCWLWATALVPRRTRSNLLPEIAQVPGKANKVNVTFHTTESLRKREWWQLTSRLLQQRTSRLTAKMERGAIPVASTCPAELNLPWLVAGAAGLPSASTAAAVWTRVAPERWFKGLPLRAQLGMSTADEWECSGQVTVHALLVTSFCLCLFICKVGDNDSTYLCHEICQGFNKP